MKKIVATLISLIVLSMAALPATAQTRRRCATNQTTYSRYDNRYDRSRSYDSRYDARYGNRVYRTESTYRNDGYDNDGYYDNRSVWQKHRDKLTTAGGAV